MSPARRYTVAEVCAAGPCEEYSAARVAALWAAATVDPTAGLTAAQIAGLPIPPADCRWALYHVVLTAESQRAFIVALAQRALARLDDAALAPLTRAIVGMAMATRSSRAVMSASAQIQHRLTQALDRSVDRRDDTFDDLTVIARLLRGDAYEAAYAGVRAAAGYSYREANWQVATALALAMGWPLPAAPGDGPEVVP
jgi:hypothetical protein